MINHSTRPTPRRTRDARPRAVTRGRAGRPAHVFRFSLQRVLDLRERQQRDAAAALAAAQDVADAARRAEAAIQHARAELVSAGLAPASAGASVGARSMTAFLLSRLDEQAKSAGAATEAAVLAVTGREGALQAAYRDRRALDRLRERHQIAWQSGAVAADRQQMDEIALSRFTQRAVRSSGAA